MYSSSGAGTAPFVKAVSSVTRFRVRFGCQWEMILPSSTSMVSVSPVRRFFVPLAFSFLYLKKRNTVDGGV